MPSTWESGCRNQSAARSGLPATAEARAPEPVLFRVPRIETPVDRAEVLRYLGYPAGVDPPEQTRPAVDAAISEAAALARPQAVLAIFPVLSATRRRLRVRSNDGECEFQGAIGEFLGPVEQVAVFIATAGPLIERRSRELQAAGDYLGGLVYDAVGSERAEAAEAELTRNLRQRLQPEGLGLTLPYSPGYCGMALTEQKKLFALLGGQTAGVILTDVCLMQPTKSISGLIGIGPAAAVAAAGSPCQRCELWTCNMRR